MKKSDILIRCARHEDLDALLKLSIMLPPGMTSMPYDRKTWEQKLDKVASSLTEPPPKNQEGVYQLVMEDTGTGEIVGCAGIISRVGLTSPFYSYKLSTETKVSEEHGIRRISTLLNLVNDFTGDTELISLFLKPEYRHGRKYAGQFLSRCRYVFMSDFPERFSDTVFAEIRGWLDKHSNSPFWQHLGEKFFRLPFPEADFISAVKGSQFITELMPHFPIYKELLPDAAVAVIGKPHDEAMPAMKLLEREGFSYENTIDIFDGGPVMQCKRADIASINNTRACTIKSVVDEHEVAGRGNKKQHEAPVVCILSNRQLADYRLVLGPVVFHSGQDAVAGSQETKPSGAKSPGTKSSGTKPSETKSTETKPLGVTLRCLEADTLGVSEGDTIMALAIR
ncbi:MAG: arginine N-succinyltransferase [Pseudohongiellaceae bacterium]